MTDTQRLADDCFFAYYVDDETDEKKTGQKIFRLLATSISILQYGTVPTEPAAFLVLAAVECAQN